MCLILGGKGWDWGLNSEQSRPSIIWATPPVHFVLVILERGSCELFVQSGLKLQSSWSQPLAGKLVLKVGATGMPGCLGILDLKSTEPRVLPNWAPKESWAASKYNRCCSVGLYLHISLESQKNLVFPKGLRMPFCLVLLLNKIVGCMQWCFKKHLEVDFTHTVSSWKIIAPCTSL
jgi:hypothetical protein